MKAIDEQLERFERQEGFLRREFVETCDRLAGWEGILRGRKLLSRLDELGLRMAQLDREMAAFLQKHQCQE